MGEAVMESEATARPSIQAAKKFVPSVVTFAAYWLRAAFCSTACETGTSPATRTAEEMRIKSANELRIVRLVRTNRSTRHLRDRVRHPVVGARPLRAERQSAGVGRAEVAVVDATREMAERRLNLVIAGDRIVADAPPFARRAFRRHLWQQVERERTRCFGRMREVGLV